MECDIFSVLATRWVDSFDLHGAYRQMEGFYRSVVHPQALFFKRLKSILGKVE